VTELGRTHATRRLVPPADLEPWEVFSEGFELVAASHPGADADGRAAILFAEAGSSVVHIPGSFPLAEFDRVAVDLRCSGRLKLGAWTVRDAEMTGRSSGLAVVTPSPDPQVAILPMEDLMSSDLPSSEIRLRGRQLKGQWTLLRVDLLQPQTIHRLSEPEDGGAALITIGEEARRGWVLSGGGRGATEFTVPRRGPRTPAGGHLTIEYCFPKELQPPGMQGRLAVELFRDDRQCLRRVLAPDERGGWVAWGRAELDLSRWAGERLRVELGLTDSGEGGAVCVLSEPVVHQPLLDPATVLLVTSDTHRADHLGAADQGIEIDTPILDELARRGWVFEDCFSSANVTLPSRAALMTATHPRDTGVISNRNALSERARTLAECFREAGYLTWAATSASVLADDASGLGQGFDRMRWPEAPALDAAVTIDRACAWLPEARGRKLFLWLHLFDAHTPYEPPLDLQRRYYPADRDPYGSEHPEDSFPAPRSMPGLRDPEWARAQYRGEVTYLDRELGRVLRRERFRAGVVAVTADHGECLGDKGIYWSHAGLYPATLHVPLILSFPGIEGGQRFDHPVRQIDVGRTLLDLSGLERTEFPGNSLVVGSRAAPLVSRPRFALAAEGYAASVTVGSWHLILHLRREGEAGWWAGEEYRAPRHGVELYELESDPRCQRDRSGEELDRARRMRELLVEWLQTPEPTGWALPESENPQLMQQLAELGYATDGRTPPVARLFDADCDCERCQRFR